jgi:hypothetical protein
MHKACTEQPAGFDRIALQIRHKVQVSHVNIRAGSSPIVGFSHFRLTRSRLAETSDLTLRTLLGYYITSVSSPHRDRHITPSLSPLAQFEMPTA